MTDNNPHEQILQLLITGGFLDPGKLKEARDIIGECAPSASGSLEDAAKDYADFQVGECDIDEDAHDPDFVAEYKKVWNSVKAAFLAGASHSFNKESFLKALREGLPPYGSLNAQNAWVECCDKAEQLLNQSK